MQTDFSQFGAWLFAGLLVLIIYRRLRRSFGPQLLRPTRMMVRLGLLALLVCVLLPAALRSGEFLAAELLGAVCGTGLGAWGAARTRFLMRDGRLHYVPHTYTGIAVSLLFLGRLAYRAALLYGNPQGGHVAGASQAFSPDPTLHPLTVGIFFVLAGYYMYYYAWILRRSKHLSSSDLEVAEAPAP